MASPSKKRVAKGLDRNPLQKNESESSHDEDVGMDDDERHLQEEIQVDFEGRNPCVTDFHGIKTLLQQLFLKAHVDLSELTDKIISQNDVGSVVKQSLNDEDEDDDDDDNDANDVFGITSVINLSDKQQCIQQLRTLLVELCDEHGSDQAINFVRTLLGDESRPVGLLINERFVNIPAQIAVPLLENLSKEIKRAKEKDVRFNFSYFIIICKLYKMDNASKSKKKNKKQAPPEEPEILWSNPEEELIVQEAECSFEFTVRNESDSGLGGHWEEDDAEMTPFRRVLLVPANKLDDIIEKVKKMVS